MSVITSLLPLLSLLALPSMAQQAGQWTMNASIPQTDPAISGCVILAQLTSTTTPPTLQAFVPICPSTTPVPTDPFTGMTIHWPLAANANDGQGIASDLVMYGQLAHKADRTDVRMAQAGCVMRLTSDQAQYLLGRSLTWNNNLQELWDNTGDGFILNPAGDAAMACGSDDVLLPETLWFPDPYVVPATDMTWQEPLLLAVPKAPVNSDNTSCTMTDTAPSSTETVVGIQTSSAATASSQDTAATSTDSATLTSTTASSANNVDVPASTGTEPSLTASETTCEKETVTVTVEQEPTMVRRYPPVL